MPKLTIDGKPVEVEPGATILQAARSVGIEIPTLCYADGREPLSIDLRVPSRPSYRPVN